MQQDWGYWQGVLEATGIIVAIVIAIAGLVWVFYDRRRNRRRLGYYIESNSALISTKVLESHRLKLNYDGEEIDNPHRLAISFYNLGRQPITSEEFEQPLTINSNTSKFLSVTKSNSQPIYLDPDPLIEPNKIIVEPLLLNSEDWFTLATVTDGRVSPTIRGRIVEIKEIETLDERPLFGASRLKIRFTKVLTLFILVVLVAAILIPIFVPNARGAFMLLPFVCITFLAGLMAFTLSHGTIGE